MFTKAGSIIDLGLFSIQLSVWDDLNPLDLAIAKESKRREQAYCATSGKTFGNGTVLTSLVPQKAITLSAVCMNLDQKALQDGSVGIITTA